MSINIDREVEVLFSDGCVQGQIKAEIEELEGEGFKCRLKILNELERDVDEANIYFEDIKSHIITTISSINSIDKPIDRIKPRSLGDFSPKQLLDALIKIEDRLFDAETDARQSKKAAEVLPTLKRCYNDIRNSLNKIQSQIESKWLKSNPRVDAKYIATKNAVKLTLDNIKTLKRQCQECNKMISSIIPQIEIIIGSIAAATEATAAVNTHQRTPQRQTQNQSRWVCPQYQCEMLKEAENPNSFKIWKTGIKNWFACGGENLPATAIQYSTLLRFIPQDIQERIGDDINGLNNDKTLDMNLDVIEKYMLKAYPKHKRRLQIYDLIEHSNDIKYTDMIQKIRRESLACNYNDQSPTQILIGQIVASCTEPNLIKFMADNSNAISIITVFEEFENLIISENEKLESSLAYPGYTGLGAKSKTKAHFNINAVQKTDRNSKLPKAFKLGQDGKPPPWMTKLACFDCGEKGHTLHECTTNPGKCGIDGCNRYHNQKAHKNWIDHKAAKEAKKIKHKSTQ